MPFTILEMFQRILVPVTDSDKVNGFDEPIKRDRLTSLAGVKELSNLDDFIICERAIVLAKKALEFLRIDPMTDTQSAQVVPHIVTLVYFFICELAFRPSWRQLPSTRP